MLPALINSVSPVIKTHGAAVEAAAAAAAAAIWTLCHVMWYHVVGPGGGGVDQS